MRDHPHGTDPAEQPQLSLPPSPPFSAPPLETISPEFDSRVDIYLSQPLRFKHWADVQEGAYGPRGFEASDKRLSAECALVKVTGPLRHPASTRLNFRDGNSGKLFY